MKREGWNHSKFRLLARDLKIPVCYARGILESLWILCGINFPAGDVGRITNEEIAVGIDYEGDPEELIALLLKRRILDAIPEGRLYIHDWHDHCDDATHLRLARHTKLFANGDVPRLTRLGEKERLKIIDRYKSAGVSESALNEALGIGSLSHPVRTESARRAHKKPLPEPEPEPEPAAAAAVSESTSADRATADSEPDLDASMPVWLWEFAQISGLSEWGQPDNAICTRCVAACRGRPPDDIHEFLVSLLKRKRKPAQSYAWFERVLLDQFGGTNGNGKVTGPEGSRPSRIPVQRMQRYGTG